MKKYNAIWPIISVCNNVQLLSDLILRYYNERQTNHNLRLNLTEVKLNEPRSWFIKKNQYYCIEASFINEDGVILKSNLFWQYLVSNDTTFNVSKAQISLDGKGYDTKRN